MKTVIHVNQHVIKANRVHHKNDPALTVKTYKSNRKAHTAVIRCKETDRELGRFIHSPKQPLSCGARVWFETQEDVYVDIQE